MRWQWFRCLRAPGPPELGPPTPVLDPEWLPASCCGLEQTLGTHRASVLGSDSASRPLTLCVSSPCCGQPRARVCVHGSPGLRREAFPGQRPSPRPFSDPRGLFGCRSRGGLPACAPVCLAFLTLGSHVFLFICLWCSPGNAWFDGILPSLLAVASQRQKLISRAVSDLSSPRALRPASCSRRSDPWVATCARPAPPCRACLLVHFAPLLFVQIFLHLLLKKKIS